MFQTLYEISKNLIFVWKYVWKYVNINVSEKKKNEGPEPQRLSAAWSLPEGS